MTAREEALALLRERFPEPWAIEVVRLDSSCFVARAGTEPAERGPNPVRVYAEGDTAISAARACIAAWDEATAAERSALIAAARTIAVDGIEKMAADAAAIGTKALAAERALADRLGEALERLGSMEAFHMAMATPKQERLWPEVEARMDYARQQAAAWREARGKA